LSPLCAFRTLAGAGLPLFNDVVQGVSVVKTLTGLRFPGLLESHHELVGSSCVLLDDGLRQVAGRSA